MEKLVLLCVAATTVIVGATTATAATHGPPTAAATTLVLHARTTAFSELDLGAAGPTPGDESFRKEDLTDSAGRPVGVLNSQCTSLVPGDPFTEQDELCTGVITLTGRGKIHFQSLAVLTPPPPPPAPGWAATARPSLMGSPWAILGGTRDFHNARGQIFDRGDSAADHYLHIYLSS